MAKEISFGPIVNPDGSPTEFTKQMMGVNSDEEERERYVNRIDEMRLAILNDFATENWTEDHFLDATLEATRQCVVEMQHLRKMVKRIDEKRYQELRSEYCNADCGCAGGQKIRECLLYPSCGKCFN